MPNTLIQPLWLALQVAALLIVSACGAGSQVSEPDVAEQVRRVETGLLTHNVVPDESGFTIQERMRFYQVPAVSVAVIEGGEILWANAWGEVESGSGVQVDTTTLFQAASISKPVAAAGALRLVEQGLFELDTDVNLILRSWQIPENPFTATEKVTVRRLLSHSAGTTVHGFPGYAADEDVPSLAEVLDGDSPANTAAVRVDAVPGSRWRYSGGGTSIVQLLMEDVSGRPFADLMQELVLDPAGMRRSTFAQPLPAERLGEAATAHGADGTPIAGKHHTYPEQAAAGLWTTPTDLARFAIEIQRAFAGSSELLLSPAMAREMLRPEADNYGLGFSLQGEADELSFEHGGANAGFRSHLVMFAESGDGAVVMTNGDGGAGLATEILRSIAREYDYPTFQPIVREAVDLPPSALAAFVGDYFAVGDDVPAGPLLRIRLDGDALYADVPPARWTDRSLRAGSERTFFFLENAGEIRFEKDEAGAVIGAVISGLGEPIQLVRR